MNKGERPCWEGSIGPKKTASDGLGRAKNAVCGKRRNLTLRKRIVELEKVGHVIAYRDHRNVTTLKHALPVGHHGGGFSGVHKHVHVLGAQERVTGHLIVADMGTEDYKAVLTAAVKLVKTVVLTLHIELLAGISGKPVKHHHAHIEHIKVYVEGASKAAVAHPLAEETPGCEAPLAVKQDVERYYKGHYAVQEP